MAKPRGLGGKVQRVGWQSLEVWVAKSRGLGSKVYAGKSRGLGGKV